MNGWMGGRWMGERGKKERQKARKILLLLTSWVLLTHAVAVQRN